AGAYIGRAGCDYHRDSELRALLAPLAELAAKRRVAVVLVKHLNKGVSARAVHKVSGSTGYVNSVRAAFLVAPDPQDPDRKLFLPLKFNIGPKPQGFAFRLKGAGSRGGRPPAGALRSPRRRGPRAARRAAVSAGVGRARGR